MYVNVSRYLWKMKNKKSSSFVPSWTRRWFSIEGPELKWYATQHAAEASGQIYLKVSLSVYWSVCLCVSVCVCVSTGLSTGLSTCLSTGLHVNWSVYLSVCLPFSLSVYLFLWLSTGLSTWGMREGRRVFVSVSDWVRECGRDWWINYGDLFGYILLLVNNVCIYLLFSSSIEWVLYSMRMEFTGRLSNIFVHEWVTVCNCDIVL
jgi:hypothetical protein